jgi:adenylosuccinate synthase
MPVDIILGLQWGDEGKGKIVDLLSKNYSTIARFQGGPNAGHTIIIGDKKFVLHQIPSGMTREGVMNIIGNGVVLDPIVLNAEIDKLEAAGIEVKSRLLISRKANLILPTHKLMDSINESQKGEFKIGSTLKGIGPTYQDKTGRFGLRIGDIFSKDFDKLYEERKNRHLCYLQSMGYEGSVDDTAWMEALERTRQLKFIDAEYYLNEKLKAGEKILGEGAQGTLLDIDFGTYPYVTSSNTITASACTGLGISTKQVGTVYGVFKAYTTRVGGGPFPTELNDATGEFIRQKGFEFGSTTGRPRRTGWLDIPALQYAIMLNGVDELIMMKLDVLNELEKIEVCTSYKNESGKTNFSELSFGESVEPVYESVKGWNSDLSHVSQYEQFPAEVKSYIDFIERKAGKRISLISTGPEREQSIKR